MPFHLKFKVNVIQQEPGVIEKQCQSSSAVTIENYDSQAELNCLQTLDSGLW